MTTTTHPETTISADPDVPLVRIVRDFAATPDQVFRAHVDPDLLVQWLGPRDVTMTVDRFDARTGGEYRYVHHRGDEEYGFHGSFHDVRPEDHTIVQTFAFEGMPDHVALERLVLTDLGDGRTRLEATSLVDSFADRDAFLASGMEDGVTQGYEALDELLAG